MVKEKFVLQQILIANWLHEHWNIILLQIFHDFKSPSTQHFAHTASVLKVQSGQFSLRSHINNGRIIYNYSCLLQFSTCFFLLVDLLIGPAAQNETKCIQISTSRRSFFRRTIHSLGKWLPNRSPNKKHKTCCPTFWALRSEDMAT
jgi:hypothetical protein